MRASPTSFHWHRRVWRLAWPIVLSNLSIPLVGAVDTAVVGHLPDPNFIGAVALGAVIFSFLFWGFGFLRMGTTGFIAQAHGRGDSGEIVATTFRALLLALLLGAGVILVQKPVAILAFWALEGGAHLEGLAAQYFQIRVWSAPATLVNYTVLGVLIGLQRTGTALMLQLLLNGCNIALDLVFVVGFAWGVEGVALASLTADWLAAIAGAAVLTRLMPRREFAVDRKRLLAPDRMWALLRVNANIMVRTLCLIFAFFYFTAQGTRLGEQTLAANAVLMHMQHFLAYGLDGFAHAAEALAGGAFGAGRLRQFRSAVRATTLWATVVAVGYALVYATFGDAIVSLMTDIEPVRQRANEFLPWLVVLPLLSVWSFQLDGIFIGATRTTEMRNGMIISLAVYLSGAWVLVPLLGNHGLWLALSVFMISRAVTLALWYPRIERELDL